MKHIAIDEIVCFSALASPQGLELRLEVQIGSLLPVPFPGAAQHRHPRTSQADRRTGFSHFAMPLSGHAYHLFRCSVHVETP